MCSVESDSMASTSRQSEIETVNAFDGLAPQSASTSATSSSPLQKLAYDVFINHRGPDVKHELARDIYNALHATPLKVFLDSQDLELGDFFPGELQEAMSRASLHVAIFSPTYAQSPWCLAELSFMLKTGTPIIPIFYRVQPEDLRHLVHGKGIYSDFFLKHQEKGRYNTDKLEEWKMALHSVSFYMGESVNSNEEKQRVLKNIVNRVLKIMKIVPLEVATHPVGLKEAVADFEMKISEKKSYSDVQILGIWGMGGSGKTTLAKELYNQKCSSMRKSSFLFDIRNAASTNKLHNMQIQLLRDLKLEFNNQPHTNIEQGRKILSNSLRSVPVFIILDDVDHRDQLEALLPEKGSLASGSLIIVTTRDKEVLRVWGISCIYEMKSMNHSHARQLFCWHAFIQPSPLLGFEDLVEKFIIASDGLPLSLKVFGGQLYGCSNKDLWEDVLHKISRILPDDIINRLRVSYDALDKEEQQMFLDIACFFIGKNKMTAIAVWEGSGWSGLWGWERLVNKCLVELVHENEIRMHDHLRDLGRQIARSLSPHRLWSPDQLTVINEHEEIRGIILNAATNDVQKFPNFMLNTSIWLCGFRKTRRPCPYGLKVFVVGEDFRNNLYIAKSSRELAWLSCTRIAHRNLPSWMPLKNLRVLELHDCDKIVGFWKDGVEAPVQLRVLIISRCSKLQRIPKSIGYLVNLKKISLYECNVESLPEEFCRLQSLEHLKLSYCRRLSSLPSHFGHLRDLRHLEMKGCKALGMLPDSCKQLTLLQHLDLEECKMLTLQPDILENMTKLQYLNFNWCTQLELLPRHITNQASLSELYLWNSRLRQLPINIGQLSKLRVMEILPRAGCFQMQSLPDSMGSLTLLERLVLRNLQVQSSLLSLKQLINLQTLHIAECPISKLDFGQGEFTSSLSNLKEIHLSHTRLSKISISDDCCPGLQILSLRCNDHLTEVDTLPTAVNDIYVERCKLLRNIRGIGGVINLHKLKISGCVERCKLLRNIRGIGGVINLHKLKISGCPELYMLPSFDKLVSLKIFSLDGGNKVEAIQGLQHCTSLEELRINGNRWEVSGIESWEHVQRLRELQLLAKKRSVVERCIQTIQKWPDDVMICTNAVAGEGSLLNSLAFPNLSIVHPVAIKKTSHYKEIKFDLFNGSSDGNAMMLCFVINCSFPRMILHIGNSNITWWGELADAVKCTWIGVFTKPSKWLTAREINICTYEDYEKNNEVEIGMVVRGEQESVLEGFHRLLPLLSNN